MRLLNTRTFRFQEFFAGKKPPYSILSHVWGPDEVSYQKFLRCKHEIGPGYEKIYRFGEYSRDQGYEWCWIDTCCIDKASSSEVSEAINAKFKWYENSRLCVVYLQDVSGPCSVDNSVASSWFKKGSTLQELMAPHLLHFMTVEWKCFRVLNKLHHSILDSSLDADNVSTAEWLMSKTGIPRKCLTTVWVIARKSVNIAEIMHWASSRATSCDEDVAYCLLGLFDIDLPLRYGEGKRAYRRLQKKLVKKYPEDHSIYLWDASAARPGDGMLAVSPRSFMNSDNLHIDYDINQKCSYTWSGTGIKYRGPARRVVSRSLDAFVIDILHPARVDMSPRQATEFILLRLADRSNQEYVARYTEEEAENLLEMTRDNWRFEQLDDALILIKAFSD